VKETVLPVPDPQLVAFWLKVNVGRTRVQGVHEDAVDDAYGNGHLVAAQVSCLTLLAKNERKFSTGAEVGLGIVGYLGHDGG
jgi:hypothetical protein